ncbi:unnamed protein product [Aphanomyces euteiches]
MTMETNTQTFLHQTTNCLTLLETSSEWRALVHPHLNIDTIIQIFNLDDVPDAVVDQLLPLAVACMFADGTNCTNDTHPLATTMLSAHDDDSVAKIAAFFNRLYLSDEWIRVRGSLPCQEAALASKFEGSLFSQAKNLLPLTAMNADVRHACDAPKAVRVYQSHMSRYCNPKESLSEPKPPPIPRDARWQGTLTAACLVRKALAAQQIFTHSIQSLHEVSTHSGLSHSNKHTVNKDTNNTKDAMTKQISPQCKDHEKPSTSFVFTTLGDMGKTEVQTAFKEAKQQLFELQMTSCLYLLETSNKWQDQMHPHLDHESIRQGFKLDEIPDSVVNQLLPLAVACMFVNCTNYTNGTYPPPSTMPSVDDDETVAKIIAFVKRLHSSDKWAYVRGYWLVQAAIRQFKLEDSIEERAHTLLPLVQAAINVEVRYGSEIHPVNQYVKAFQEEQARKETPYVAKNQTESKTRSNNYFPYNCRTKAEAKLKEREYLSYFYDKPTKQTQSPSVSSKPLQESQRKTIKGIKIKRDTKTFPYESTGVSAAASDQL